MRAGAPLVCGMCAEAAEYRDDIILRFGVLLIYCDAFASVMLCAAVDCLFYSFSLINKNKKKQKTQTHACETTSWGIHLQWDTVPWRFWSNCTEILALQSRALTKWVVHVHFIFLCWHFPHFSVSIFKIVHGKHLEAGDGDGDGDGDRPEQEPGSLTRPWNFTEQQMWRTHTSASHADQAPTHSESEKGFFFFF